MNDPREQHLDRLRELHEARGRRPLTEAELWEVAARHRALGDEDQAQAAEAEAAEASARWRQRQLAPTPQQARFDLPPETAGAQPTPALLRGTGPSAILAVTLFCVTMGLATLYLLWRAPPPGFPREEALLQGEPGESPVGTTPVEGEGAAGEPGSEPLTFGTPNPPTVGGTGTGTGTGTGSGAVTPGAGGTTGGTGLAVPGTPATGTGTGTATGTAGGAAGASPGD